MEFVTHLEQLATALTRQFGCEEMNLTVQMRRGDDWITVDVYRNAENPDRFHATMDFDTGVPFLLETAQTIH